MAYVFMFEVRESAQFVVDSSSKWRRLEVGKFLDSEFTAVYLRFHAPVDILHNVVVDSNQVTQLVIQKHSYWQRLTMNNLSLG